MNSRISLHDFKGLEGRSLAHEKTGAFFEAARCYAQAGEKELAFA
jgi:hypothetical protein